MKLITLLRAVRNTAYRLIDPLDAVFLRVNRMGSFPPISLRRHVSTLGFLDGPGAEYCAYLRLLAGLKDGGRILDMACGCGFLEIALERCGWRGGVVGYDIHKPSIEWCRRNISKRAPSFQFHHADIFNEAYWRNGRFTARDWLAQFRETGFDCIVAKSLFTHMLPEELAIYVSDATSRLKPDGKMILSFFLLDEEQRRLQREGSSRINFTKPDESAPYGVRLLRAPTAAVAYETQYLLELFEKSGLKAQIYHGYWSGRSNGLSFQDLVVVEKRD